MVVFTNPNNRNRSSSQVRIVYVVGVVVDVVNLSCQRRHLIWQSFDGRS